MNSSSSSRSLSFLISDNHVPLLPSQLGNSFMLEQEEQSSSVSLRQTKPISYAFKVLNSQETVFHYKKRMGYFFNYLRLPSVNSEEQALEFMKHAIKNQNYVEETIIDYLDYQKQRVKNHQLPDELHKKLKVKAAQDGRTMTELVVECLEKIVK